MITTRIFLIILLFTVSEIESQNKADLENQKKEILNEIKIIENKLASSKERKGLFVSRAEDIKFKIDLQENLIKNINDQLNLILTNIEINEHNNELLETSPYPPSTSIPASPSSAVPMISLLSMV